jgi:hypothetical protein
MGPALHPRRKDGHRTRTSQEKGRSVTDPITIWAPTTIQQTARERLAEAVRLGGIRWHRANNPDWRDKPWMHGVPVDLDESDVVECIVQTIVDLADPERPAA